MCPFWPKCSSFKPGSLKNWKIKGITNDSSVNCERANNNYYGGCKKTHILFHTQLALKFYTGAPFKKGCEA